MIHCTKNLIKTIYIGLFFSVTAVISDALSDAKRAMPPLLVASIHPLNLLAQDVAGGQVRVKTLLPAGQNPHHVALSFSQGRLLKNADLFLWVGPSMEASLVKSLARRKQSTVLALDLGITAEARNMDAHAWLDPGVAGAFGNKIIASLKKQYPAMSSFFVETSQQPNGRYPQKIAELQQRMTALSGLSFIAEHDSYGYFTRYFKLNNAWAITDNKGVEQGIKGFHQLGTKTGIRCVAVEQLPGSKRAQYLAERLKVPLVVIDPMGRDVDSRQGYLGLLEAVAQGFEQCLAGK